MNFDETTNFHKFEIKTFVVKCSFFQCENVRFKLDIMHVKAATYLPKQASWRIFSKTEITWTTSEEEKKNSEYQIYEFLFVVRLHKKNN